MVAPSDPPAPPVRTDPAPGDASSTPSPVAALTLTDQELFERLGWFVSIRWAAGAGALILSLVAWRVFGVQLPATAVGLTIGVLFLYNAVFLLLVTDAYRRQRISRRFISGCANAQITCDLVTLAVLMHFTGGIENPFLIFVICPLVIASELLPARQAYGYAAAAAVIIQGVAWLEFAGVLSHVPVGASVGAPTYRSALAVMTFSVALTLLAFATVFLGSSIATRLRYRERDLERAYHQARELERSKSQLMRRTSHDLRAPLDALISLLRVVVDQARGTCDPKLVELLGRAERRALGLTHLIDELHRYAVVRETVTRMPMTPVQLAEIVTQVSGMYELMAAEKGVRLTCATRPVTVRGNEQALAEMLGNLVSNAIQYTPDGGTIQVSLEPAQDGAALAVADSGIGISPEAQRHVFDEFYRADNAKAVFTGGTGMGLPIVQRIVEAHGGSISVTSAVGKGTRFRVLLPSDPAATLDRGRSARESPSE